MLVFTLWKSLHLMEQIEPPAVPTSPAGPAYEDLGPTPAPKTVRTGQSGSKPKCLKAEEKPTSLFAPTIKSTYNEATTDLHNINQDNILLRL